MRYRLCTIDRVTDRVVHRGPCSELALWKLTMIADDLTAKDKAFRYHIEDEHGNVVRERMDGVK